MSKNRNFHGLSGKIGGLAVKGMIQSVEEDMAEGKQVSAAPSSPEEAEHLKNVKEANTKSGN